MMSVAAGKTCGSLATILKLLNHALGDQCSPWLQLGLYRHLVIFSSWLFWEQVSRAKDEIAIGAVCL